MYTGSNGWKYTNKDTWGDHYNYDDPKFQESIGWWRSLIEKGYMPPLEKTVGASRDRQQFGAGNSAMITEGDWNMNGHTSARGRRRRHRADPGRTERQAGEHVQRPGRLHLGRASKNQAAAWKWVKYLASAECQDIVGEAGVVFPAIPSAHRRRPRPRSRPRAST